MNIRTQYELKQKLLQAPPEHINPALQPAIALLEIPLDTSQLDVLVWVAQQQNMTSAQGISAITAILAQLQEDQSAPHARPLHWFAYGQPAGLLRVLRVAQWWLWARTRGPADVPQWALAWLMFVPGTGRAAMAEIRHRLKILQEDNETGIARMRAQCDCGPKCMLTACGRDMPCRADAMWEQNRARLACVPPK